MLVVLGGIGCSPPHQNVVADGAISDTATDASPDAPSCPASSNDLDGDCVDDAIDVCPNVADPAQVDLDGDHIGWMCDPIESVAIPGARGDTVKAASYGNTFAAVVTSIHSGPSGPVWDHAIVAASLAGKLIIPNASTDPAHQWTLSRDIAFPVIDADNHVWWSHKDGNAGEAGLVDLVAGTFTKKSDGMLSTFGYVYDGNASGLIAIVNPSPTTQYAVFSPQNGALVQLDALTPVWWVEMLGSPPTAVYTAQSSIPGKYAIRKYVLGSSTATDVMLGATPLNDLDEVRQYNQRGILPTGDLIADLSEIPHCIRQGSLVRYIGVSATGVSSGTLPFAPGVGLTDACPYDGTQTFGKTALFMNTANDGPGKNVVTVHDGVVTRTIDGYPNNMYVDIHGDQIPILDNGGQQWAVAPDRSIVALANDYSFQVAGYVGDVIHLALFSRQNSDLILLRYRPTTGVERFVLRPNAGTNPGQIVLTTADGTAIVADGSGTSWLLPLASNSVTTLPSFSVEGGFVRGGQTVVAVKSPTSGNTIYAYDQPGGVPRWTQLTQPGQPMPNELGPVWFAIASTATCQIARVTLDAQGTPTLDAPINCIEPSGLPGVTYLGKTASGLTVAATRRRLYLLSATTATEVARAVTPSTLQMIRDITVPTQPIVGWTGLDMLGSFACLASHPDRCWSIPSAPIVFTWGDSTSTSDGSIAVALLDDPTFTIMRSIGPGTRPPPLF